MYIHNLFPGGNIHIEKIEQNTIYLERELRDTEDDWFYWAFCVEGAANRTVTFRFSSPNRVGRFGPAVSTDLFHWHWLDAPTIGEAFTYTFGENENCTYFTHDMLYQPSRFTTFCAQHGLVEQYFCTSVSGQELPCVRFGSGDKWILLTARHHACEATGSYVLEGVVETLLPILPKEFSVLIVPFIDLDGVVHGDQGKNRLPHDHNRDYTDAPIYAVIDTLMKFGQNHELVYTFDFHSPWHMWEQNDHVFLSRSTEAMEKETDRFAAFLREETAGQTLHYDRVHDVGPNEQWNDETSPNSKNYFAKQSTVRLTATLETPYFGLPEAKVSQPALVELGHSFARAILRYASADIR